MIGPTSNHRAPKGRFERSSSSRRLRILGAWVCGGHVVRADLQQIVVPATPVFHDFTVALRVNPFQGLEIREFAKKSLLLGHVHLDRTPVITPVHLVWTPARLCQKYFCRVWIKVWIRVLNSNSVMETEMVKLDKTHKLLEKELEEEEKQN